MFHVFFFPQAETEIQSYNRRIRLVEEDLETTEVRLQEAMAKLEAASEQADESNRWVKSISVTEKITIQSKHQI